MSAETSKAPAPPSRPEASNSDAGLQSRYSVREQLAAGGMGVVYRVYDRVLDRECALKRVNSKSSEDRYYVEAFEREYHVLKTLEHPRIIRVFDYGIDPEGPFYTMELLDGQDMRRAAPLPYHEACACLRDVATSLSLLHARRLVHRDLSPGNVRMTRDGRCKLLDFGALASFGSSHVVVGTPPFVAPEALTFAPLDARTDLYALGALAYWLLTGRHAFAARDLQALIELWKVAPHPPSFFVQGIPEELDALVLSLLSADLRARPASAAEVTARLTVIGDLAEDATETAQLALSFLSCPRFVGRKQALDQLQAMTEGAIGGRGGAVIIDAAAGMGRSRLLEEVGIAAQLAGAAVIRVDASTSRQVNGTARALAMRVLDALPFVAQRHIEPCRAALTELGPDVKVRLGPRPERGASSGVELPPARALERWFTAISRETPLVLQIDNLEDADDATLGLLAALAKEAPEYPMVVVATLRGGGTGAPLGISTVCERSTRIELPGFTASEMLELTRSLFGDAPKVERFAEWLLEWTAGSPLHALEVSRQLLFKGIVRYVSGVWTLPDRVQAAEVPAALSDALSARLGRLSEEAKILAECLSLQRERATPELCRLLVDRKNEHGVQGLLNELAQHDVLHFDGDACRFSSTALRETLLTRMSASELEQNHRRLGRALVHLCGQNGGDNSALRLQAGFHLIQGGDESGAETIAAVTHNALTGTLIANLHRAGPPLDAAIRVYDRQRRSIYERMPLLAALAQAGFYEDRSWGERYGAEALNVLEDISGLRTARFLRRFIGGWLSLIVGILGAYVRFCLSPKAERRYSFDKILVQLFTAVTTLTGAASLSLDAELAARIAAVLEPFAVLPERLTPVGIYQYCFALQHIARDDQAGAYDTFNELLTRFENPRYYPTLPPDARKLYVAGAHFARGAMAIFRTDGQGALESADALDAAGLKLYAMIASQLRWLYYTLRGEFSKAAPHRQQLEEHAAHVGSVWQVETWQGASLMTVYPLIDDIVNCTRIAHQLEYQSRSVPSLKRSAKLARGALLMIRGELSDPSKVSHAFPSLQSAKPREWVGWTLLSGCLARSHNVIGEHAVAKELCEAALGISSHRDRNFGSLFLMLELELAVANAALGSVEVALGEIDRQLSLYEHYDHPVVLGLLHETRGQIACRAGRAAEHARSLAEMERLFFPTETPLLIARCKRLSELGAQTTLLSELGAHTSSLPRNLDASEESTDTMVFLDDGGTTEHAPEADRSPVTEELASRGRAG